ncbi:MAG: DUF3996 domain-containing protein [Bacteroidota bacterium]|nr:DUF3996 domain-containing protein [Bacteroidota bacterium]
MKKLLLVLIVSTFSLGLFAQNDGFGLGAIFGEPTGLSAKVWTSQKTAIDGALAWSFAGSGFFHIHTDFLVHNFDLIDVSEGALPVYFGLGAYMDFASDMGLGIRVPLGMAYHFESAPLEIFAEIVPGLALLPGTDFYFGGGIGIRYYF